MVLKQIKVMRRTFTYPVIPTLFLALALAGCQQEPVPATGDVIRFSVNSVGIAPAPTKADPVIPTVQPPATHLTDSGSEVKVWASLKTSQDQNWRYVFDPNPSIEITNGSSGWTYTGEKYWNRDANYKFMALYPVNADIQSDSNVDLLKVNYTDNTQDLMVAVIELAGSGAKTVDLAFNHTCSAIRVFFVDPDRGTQDVRYKITNFQLQNLYMAGTMSNDKYKFTWATSGERTTGYSWPGSSWNVPATYTAFTPWLFLIPQELKQNDGKHPAIAFSYTVGAQTLDVTLPIDTYNNQDVKWEPGKMYTYFVKIRPQAVEMTVEWTDWIFVDNEDTLTIE